MRVPGLLASLGFVAAVATITGCAGHREKPEYLMPTPLLYTAQDLHVKQWMSTPAGD